MLSWEFSGHITRVRHGSKIWGMSIISCLISQSKWKVLVFHILLNYEDRVSLEMLGEGCYNTLDSGSAQGQLWHAFHPIHPRPPEMSIDTFDCHDGDLGGGALHLVKDSSNSAQHPVMCKTDPKNSLAPNTNNSKFEKPCTREKVCRTVQKTYHG